MSSFDYKRPARQKQMSNHEMEMSHLDSLISTQWLKIALKSLILKKRLSKTLRNWNFEACTVRLKESEKTMKNYKKGFINAI